jgi:hypothetical protein
MSRGISWRQRGMLTQLLRLERERTPRGSRERWPVAWRELDYGPTGTGLRETDDPDGYDAILAHPRHQWNIEQATRRALRSLERRGLIELFQCSFAAYADTGPHNPKIVYRPIDPDEHTPGQDRYMTGVRLTSEGRRVAAALQREVR